MSIKVLVIPEDFRKDLPVLKPIVRKLMTEVVGKAAVMVCQDPLLGGVSEALKWQRIAEVIDMYPMVDLFLLIVDRDGLPGRRVSLDSLETRAASLERPRVLIGACAWQEVEVWLLAGMKDLPKEWSWSEVRAERDPKELYFEPYARQRGLLGHQNEGRDVLAREASRRYRSRIRMRCPEVKRLEGHVRSALGA